MTESPEMLFMITELIKAYQESYINSSKTNPTETFVKTTMMASLIASETVVELNELNMDGSLYKVVKEIKLIEDNKEKYQDQRVKVNFDNTLVSNVNVQNKGTVFYEICDGQIKEKDKYLDPEFNYNFKGTPQQANIVNKTIQAKLTNGITNKVNGNLNNYLANLGTKDITKYDVEKCLNCKINFEDVGFDIPSLEWSLDFSQLLKTINDAIDKLKLELDPSKLYNQLCIFIKGFGKFNLCPSRLPQIAAILPALFVKYTNDLMKLQFDWLFLFGPLVKFVVSCLANLIENIPKLTKPIVTCLINGVESLRKFWNFYSKFLIENGKVIKSSVEGLMLTYDTIDRAVFNRFKGTESPEQKKVEENKEVKTVIQENKEVKVIAKPVVQAKQEVKKIEENKPDSAHFNILKQQIQLLMNSGTDIFKNITLLALNEKEIKKAEIEFPFNIDSTFKKIKIEDVYKVKDKLNSKEKGRIIFYAFQIIQKTISEFINSSKIINIQKNLDFNNKKNILDRISNIMVSNPGFSNEEISVEFIFNGQYAKYFNNKSEGITGLDSLKSKLFEDNKNVTYYKGYYGMEHPTLVGDEVKKLLLFYFKRDTILYFYLLNKLSNKIKESDFLNDNKTKVNDLLLESLFNTYDEPNLIETFLNILFELNDINNFEKNYLNSFQTLNELYQNESFFSNLESKSKKFTNLFETINEPAIKEVVETAQATVVETVKIETKKITTEVQISTKGKPIVVPSIFETKLASDKTKLTQLKDPASMNTKYKNRIKPITAAPGALMSLLSESITNNVINPINNSDSALLKKYGLEGKVILDKPIELKYDFVKAYQENIDTPINTVLNSIILALKETQGYIEDFTGSVINALKAINEAFNRKINLSLQIGGRILNLIHLVRFILLIYKLIQKGFTDCEKISNNLYSAQDLINTVNPDLKLENVNSQEAKNIINNLNPIASNYDGVDEKQYMAISSQSNQSSTLINVTDCNNISSKMRLDNDDNLNQVYQELYNAFITT